MRKGDIIEGVVETLRFPNKGVFHQDETEITVKNTIPGQKVRARITKKHSQRAEGCLLEVLEPSPAEILPECPRFGSCGGCLYLNLPEREELALKEEQIRKLLRSADPDADTWFEGILESPVTEGYRNKMELTFGDEVKDGPMTLGMHKRGSFYDVTDADECRIVDSDFREIIHRTKVYFAAAGVPFYHRMRREGYLRHLLIRKGMKTGEILVDLVTTTQTDCLPEGREAGRKLEPEEKGTEAILLDGFRQTLLEGEYQGRIAGILHTHNDSVADVVEDQGTDVLYGKDSFEEELLGLKFTVTPFSFFQTNSFGAELLYETARKMITGAMQKPEASCAASAEMSQKPVVFDLYCGTGTISQLIAPVASKVIGVEIVEEAVEAAKENAIRNRTPNCEFIAGDVLKVIDTIEEKPDFIILDPPRDGVHPKALPKILAYGVENILYISCKPTSLARDLPLMREQGYVPVRGISVNQFPKTANVETVCLLSKLQSKEHIEIEVKMDELDLTSAESKATYDEIKAYVPEKHGLKVSSPYISQVKRKCGLDVGQNYNLSKKEDAKVPQCPPEKEAAIMDALKHFQMI